MAADPLRAKPPTTPALRAKTLGKSMAHVANTNAVVALRAGEPSRAIRLRSPLRIVAREAEAESLTAATSTFSNRVLAEHLGLSTDRQAAMARTGALPITSGEIALNLPVDAGFAHLLRLMHARLERELAAEDVPADDLVRLRVARVNVETLLALVAQRIGD